MPNKEGLLWCVMVVCLFVSVGLGLSVLFEKFAFSPPAYISLPIFFAAVVMDHTTTKKALKSGAHEVNPIVAQLIRWLGMSKAFPVLLAIMGVLVYIIWANTSPPEQLALAFAFFTVPIANGIGSVRHRHSRS